MARMTAKQAQLSSPLVQSKRLAFRNSMRSARLKAGPCPFDK
jgi:hypothetical protein